MIDIDECGIELSTADRSIEKSCIGKRVSQSGLYSKTDKWTLLLTIVGNQAGDRWLEYWTGEGTDAMRMIDFVRRIIQDIGPGT